MTPNKRERDLPCDFVEEFIQDDDGDLPPLPVGTVVDPDCLLDEWMDE